MDHSANPFAVGDKAIIALLPHENSNKLMAKWKGPFTVTKIPNWLQIEYLDGNITRLTHISYAKKYNERCQYTEPVGIPSQTRVSHLKPGVRMARLRLIAGSGSRRRRMIVHSMETIQDKWPIHSGRIRVRVIGEEGELPADLRAIVEATDQDDCIEWSVLVDLCRQRSGQRGSGCDAPMVSMELPTPLVSLPTPPTLPAAQVRQYSWHRCALKDVYEKRREFVGGNRQANRISPFLPQQIPLVVRAYLLQVVRKVRRSERSRGKHQSVSVFKYLSKNSERNMTSLIPACEKLEGGDYSCSVVRELNNSEMNLFNHVSPPTNTIYTLKTSEVRKEEEELKPRHIESMNYDVIDDATLNRDVINPDVNKPIARKRYAQKHSYGSKLGCSKSSLRVCSQTFTLIALILSIMISVVGGLFNIKLPERKTTIGNSSEPRIGSGFLASSILYILREFTVTIININGELCSCINKGMILNNNKQLIRCVKILQTKIRDEEAFCSQNLKRSRKLARSLSTSRSHGDSTLSYVTLAQNVLAGKRSGTYIFPSADFCAFTSLPWPYRLLCSPVLGRRVGRTQMEESKT